MATGIVSKPGHDPDTSRRRTRSWCERSLRWGLAEQRVMWLKLNLYTFHEAVVLRFLRRIGVWNFAKHAGFDPVYIFFRKFSGLIISPWDLLILS